MIVQWKDYKPRIRKWLGGWECFDSELAFAGNSPMDAWHAWAFGRHVTSIPPSRVAGLITYRHLPKKTMLGTMFQLLSGKVDNA